MIVGTKEGEKRYVLKPVENWGVVLVSDSSSGLGVKDKGQNANPRGRSRNVPVALGRYRSTLSFQGSYSTARVYTVSGAPYVWPNGKQEHGKSQRGPEARRACITQRCR